ncbi:tetratricopeptide repeat protein [Rhabdochlamydiaceae symbiont of Dictyostelium giganteum]|uniref:tetratricopeptide repeat protein n=1 Tax=Rhabdochlamydiaceae symbiont of Dictyostelium giganteum TaxID=3342349 RepID=UPI00384C8EB3
MTIQPLSSIIESLTQSANDPIFHDCLTEAVTLFPCGHNVNEDVAESSMKKRQVCPVDRHPITGYAPNHTLRNMARQIALLTPAFNQQMSAKAPTIDDVQMPIYALNYEVDIAHNLSSSELKKIPASEFKKRLRDEPDNGKLYRNLAKTLSLGETVSVNKKILTRELLCKKAIEFDEQDSMAYCYLADILMEERKNEIKLKEKFYSIRELYYKALSLDPNNSEVCVRAGKFLQDGATFSLLGKELGQQELYLRAIEKDPHCSIAYAALGDCFQEGSLINGLGEEFQSKKALYVKAIELSSEESRPYIDLANHLKEKEEVQVHQEVFTKEDLYIKAIELGVQESEPYFKLAQILPKQDIRLQLQLYRQAIEQDDKYPEAFFHLASIVKPYKSFLISGKEYLKKQLLCEAIKRGFVESRVYVMLADLLQKDETASLHKPMTKKELYLEAVRRNPHDSAAYVGIGSCLEAGEKEVLLKNSTQSFSSFELYKEAIRINPKEPRAYVAIGKTLGEKGQFEIEKEKYSREELYQYAIDLDPSYADPYLELAFQLGEKGSVVLENRELNKQDLLCKTLECNPYQPSVYLQLAQMIPDYEKVIIGDKMFSKKELYVKAIKLGSRHSQPYFELAELLVPDEAVMLSGNALAQKDLYLKVIHLNRHKSSAYLRLAHLLVENETVTIRGNPWNQDHLERAAEVVYLMEKYIQEVERAVNKKEAYLNLADKIEPGNLVELINGEKIDKKGLYLKCIDIDPTDGKLYIEATSFLKKGESLMLINKKRMSKEELYYKGIELLPKTAANYHWIASTLSSDEELTWTIEGKMPEIVTISRKELYVRAIKLDPVNADSYCYLADHIKPGQVQVFGRERLFQPELYLRAIMLNPKKSHPHLGLAMLLEKNGVRMVGREILSKRQLCLKALEHIRNNNLQDQEKKCHAYYHLASTLDKKEDQVTINGETISQEKLYCKVIELNREYHKAYEKLLEMEPPLASVTLMGGEILSRKDMEQKVK